MDGYLKLGSILWFIGAISAHEKQENETHVKYLILGAGLAGLSAARQLTLNGENDFLVIEGSGRIGGRVKEGTIGNYTVSLGAQWISIQNRSIDAYSQTLGVETELVDDESYTFRDNQQNDVTDQADARYDAFEAGLEHLKEIDRSLSRDRYKPDISRRSALTLGGWQPQDAVDYAIEYFTLDFEYGHKPEIGSTRYSYFVADTNMFVTDQNGTLTRIVDAIADEAFGTDSRSRLVLDTIVKTIHHDDGDLVTVETTKGDIYTAHYVIVTFSLGVMQSGNVHFEPPLPDWKEYSIAAGNYNTEFPIYLRFPADQPAFWDSTDYILYADDRRGHYTMWTNLENLMPDCRILQLSTGGNAGYRVSKFLTDAEITEELMTVLRSMYGPSIPDPEEVVLAHWAADPLQFGSYSDPTLSYSDDMMQAMRAPVGRIYFAGEAYNADGYIGYMDGAFESGRDVCKILLSCEADASKCEHYVPPYEARGCTYRAATNYDNTALVDDGSCTFPATETSTASQSNMAAVQILMTISLLISM